MAAAPEAFTIRLGISVPGLFAGLVKKLADDGKPSRAIGRAVGELEEFFHWRCPCSPEVERSAKLFTPRQVRRFSELARKAQYADLAFAVEHALATAAFRCPACQRAGTPQAVPAA